MRRCFLLLPVVLAGCAVPVLQTERENEIVIENADGSPPPPPANARSVEDFDTTTEEQRIAAASTSSGGRLLGSTVASLGDATVPGFWMSTPLVSELRDGRLTYPETGRSVEVELRPSASGSSRVSLAALRLLEAPLTGLPVLNVYAN